MNQVILLFFFILLARSQINFLENKLPNIKERRLNDDKGKINYHVLVITEKPFSEMGKYKIEEILTTHFCEVEFLEKYNSKQDIINKIGKFEAIIVRGDKIDEEIINAGKKLKIIAVAGSRYDNVDLKAATKNKICVTNTPEETTDSVAELIFGFIIFSKRNMFNGSMGYELNGKNIGIHGYGNIAKAIAKIGKGFEMNVFSFFKDKDYPDKLLEKDEIIPVYSINELYAKCSTMVICIPFSKETDKFINSSILEPMNKNGVIINISDKRIINEDDLIEFMKKNKQFSYVTDIKPDKHEIFAKNFPDRYFASPKKIGTKTFDVSINSGIDASSQILDFLKNGDETFKVNK